MKKHFKIYGALFLVVFLSSFAAAKDIDSQVEALLSKMTLQEKIGQVNQIHGEGLSNSELIKAGKIGSILNESDPRIINELQRIAVKETRMRIPILFARDVIHGYKTIFPIPLGQAATWNPQIVEDGARIAAIEATSDGIRWTFAPMIDVSRDPRWGRVAESLGEDTYLTSVLGTAMIKGFQGNDLSALNSLAACAKHFAGYGASESGKDYNTTWIPENHLRDTYLPPFYAAAKAGVATFMCSFNDINGVPSSGNKHLNIDILRNEWNFKGMLVSDWGSIEQMMAHGVSEDLKNAAKQAMNAGVDMDMMSFAYINHLEELIKSGKVSEKILDNAVRNILRLKFQLGLFDNPYVKIQKNSPYYSADALAKAKKAAVESAILLKNSNNILPLTDKIKSIAVVGPLSDAPNDQLGTWIFDGDPSKSITPLNAIRQNYSNQVKVTAEKGLTYSRDKSKEGIQKAVSAAKEADVILFFAGEESILSGEAKCRADISLPGAQTEFLDALKNTGKPVVMIVMAGRPLTIEKEVQQADAVLFAFHGGTMAGPALADLIFGKETPSGKLPITFPKMVGQIPKYYAHKMTGRPAKEIVYIDDIPVGANQFSLGSTSYFLDAGDSPLFPFGYGLSYTTFKYSEVQLSGKNLSKGGSLTATCTITNTGNKNGTETVQLYLRDKVASLAQPVRELKGFQKVFLKAGESVSVKFEITPEQLGFWNLENKKVIEPGEFQVWISKDSESGIPVSFEYK